MSERPASMLKVDSIIDSKYRIIRLIGEGGMGAVYEGKHVTTGRRVAVKVIRAGLGADGNEVLLHRFQREARAAGAIESQYIAQVFDAGQDAASGCPYLVLEYLVGEDLQQLLRRLGPLPVDLALRVFAHACSGLAKAHAASVVHRDVKPANVFLANREDGEIICKLLDFGVAKFMVDPGADEASTDTMDVAGLTQTGALVGSPLFMSPEQARGRHDIDHRADIWALGILLYKILSGHTPHERSGLGIGELIMSICLQEPPPIRQVAPWVPVELESLLSAILRLNRDERPQNVEMILTELRVLLPLGWSIDKKMLVPMDPEKQSRVSLPPLSLMPSNPSLGRLLNSSASTPANVAETLESAPVAPKTNPDPVSPSTLNPSMNVSSSGTLPSATSSPENRRPRGVALWVGVAVLALGAAGVAMMSRSEVRPAEPMPGSASSPVATAPLAAASVAPAASSASARRMECPAGTLLVPGGKFTMGADEPLLKLSQPAHSVILDTFCIDKHEVTVAEYQVCSDKGECKRPPDMPDWPKAQGALPNVHETKRTAYAELCNFGKPDRGNHPVNCVSWSLAQEYCTFRKMRLPSEAEWEYVARGAEDRKSPWGDPVDIIERMNAGGVEFTRWETKHALAPTPRLYELDDGFDGTAPVGSFPKGKTKHGADDFVGNVWEWTADWFALYEAEELVNPHGPSSGERRVIRGGSFEGGARQWIHPAFRAEQVPTATSPTIGFRCAMNL